MRSDTVRALTLEDAFWELPDVTNALRNRDLGRVFRLVGIHAQASQTRIGIATGLSQGQVSQVMNGTRQLSNIDVLERVVDGLAMPDGARMLLGLAPRYSDRAGPGEIFDGYPGIIDATVTALERLSIADGRPDALNRSFCGVGFVTASRDWLVARVTAGLPAAAPTHISSADALAVRDAFAAFQELDTKYGGAQAHAALVQYLRTQAIPLLGAGCTDAARRELFHAAAELVYLAGLTAFDSGSCGLAQRYFVYALRVAQEGEDDAFAANILAAMAHLANSHGQGVEAAQLAQAGLVAARIGNHALGMRLSIALARGFALQGDSQACARAVAEAERALDKVGEPREHRWMRFLDFAYLLGEMALCFLDLGQAQDAERFALQSMQANMGRHRRLALSHAVLATARGRLGDHNGAAEALTDALNLLSRVQSSRTLRAVGDAISAVRVPARAADPVIGRAMAILGPRTKGACCPRVSIPSLRR